MKRQPILKQLLIGAAAGLVIALVHGLGHSDPDPVLSAHGLSRLLGGAIGGALVYVAVYRVLRKDK